MDDFYTVRDAKFYEFCSAMALQAKETPERTINAEVGYGGARMMDVRWLGRSSINKLVDCLFHLDSKKKAKLNMTGASAGNMVMASLAIILPMRYICCGLNNKKREERFLVNSANFRKNVGFEIPDQCACEAVRRIFDFFLELTALTEHPSWYEYSNNVREAYYPDDDEDRVVHIYAGEKFGRGKKLRGSPENRPKPPHYISQFTVKALFDGSETVESLLAFSEEAASGFSNLYIDAPVRYAISMYRAYAGIQGKVAISYIISRYLISECSYKAVGSSDIPDFDGLLDILSIKIGSKKLDSNEFVFDDILHYRPLTRIIHITRDVDNYAAQENYLSDMEAMNSMVDILINSVDVRDIVFPILSEIIWNRKHKRLRLKTSSIDLTRDVKVWTWDGKIPSFDDYDRLLLEEGIITQATVDIMSNTEGHLPNFTEITEEGANYIFELSPVSKHLFEIDKVNGLFEASLPALNAFQIKAAHIRNGHKIATFIQGTPFVALP